MNGRGIQLNGRMAIALLLAALILVLAAAPALAWEPEGATKLQSPHPVVVKSTRYSSPSAPVTVEQRPPFQRVK
jgi:hypothetical protein